MPLPEKKAVALEVLSGNWNESMRHHFAGISQVLKRCESAHFVCQGAMVKEQFMALVEMDKRLYPEVRKRALAEYERVWEIVQERFAVNGGTLPLRLAAA